MSFQSCRTLLPTSSFLSAFSSSFHQSQRYFSALTPSAPNSTITSNDMTATPSVNAEIKSSQNPKSEQSYRKLYRNKQGEEMVFPPCKPPPGFIFVPMGNPFITRHCRKLASKVYVVFGHGSGRKPPQQKGIYVPGYVHMKVTDLFEDKRSDLEEAWKRDLESLYPRMPSDDKCEIYRLICSENPTLTRDTVSCVWRVRKYVEEQYTNLLSLGCTDYEALGAARTKAAQIVASWRKEEI